MKNTIIITIDTDRETPIRIGKPDLLSPPTPDEQKEMTLTDIECLSETLCYLIEVAAKNGFDDKKALTDKTLVKIHTILNPVEEVVDDEQAAIEKAKLVIENIESLEQVPASLNFINLFLEHFKNQEVYDELFNSLKEKEESLTVKN
jgi:hypothetical protein